jgi:hypothetical protein
MYAFAQGRQATLEKLAAEGVASQRIAELAEAMWLDVDAAMAPIIGTRGVSALFKRSVTLLRADYPWLQAGYDRAPDRGSFAALGRALSEQSTADAASANRALLEAFCRLIANLIGAPLTTRLLRPALDSAAADVAKEM